MGDWSGGGTPSKQNPSFWTNGTIPWVSPKDMKVFRIAGAEDSITADAVQGSATKLVPAGSVLLVVRSGILAHTLPVALAAVPVTLNQDMKAITPTSEVVPDFLAYYLVSAGSRILRDCSKAGTTVASVEFSALKLHAAPLPPLDEQHRIVDAIETHFSRLDAAVASLTRAKANVKRARASVLKAAVEGRLLPTEAALARAEARNYEPASVLLDRILAERKAAWAASGARGKYAEPVKPDTADAPALPEGWTYCRIDTAGDVQLGRQRAPKNHDGPHMRPYLRVANVFEARIDLSDVMEMNFTPEEFETFKLEPGDILLNEGQSPHLVGRPAMWNGERPGMCFTNSLVRFKAGPAVLPAYALAVFRAQLAARRFMKLVTITTNIAHLGAQRFAAVEFPLPPLAEQHRIVAEVDRRLSVLDALDASADANLARCARLRQSILKRAFEGRLVPAEAP
jgi:type I restriction enzyme S subunit